VLVSTREYEEGVVVQVPKQRHRSLPRWVRPLAPSAFVHCGSNTGCSFKCNESHPRRRSVPRRRLNSLSVVLAD
jgi:hypothetical protein